MCILPRSQAPQCASHLVVKLRGVHHTMESSDQNFSNSSVVSIPPQSQTAHRGVKRGVKIEIFVILWLLLKGQSGEILLGVNTSIIKEKNWRIFLYLLSLKMCMTLRSRIFWTLWSNISAKSKLISKLLKPVYQEPGWVQIMKKMEVENLVTHSLKAPAVTGSFLCWDSDYFFTVYRYTW